MRARRPRQTWFLRFARGNRGARGLAEGWEKKPFCGGIKPFVGGLVPKARVELARGCPRLILSQVRLPFRHFGTSQDYGKRAAAVKPGRQGPVLKSA